jgi:hypothetical protein
MTSAYFALSKKTVDEKLKKCKPVSLMSVFLIYLTVSSNLSTVCSLYLSIYPSIIYLSLLPSLSQARAVLTHKAEHSRAAKSTVMRGPAMRGARADDTGILVTAAACTLVKRPYP